MTRSTPFAWMESKFTRYFNASLFNFSFGCLEVKGNMQIKLHPHSLGGSLKYHALCATYQVSFCSWDHMGCWESKAKVGNISRAMWSSDCTHVAHKAFSHDGDRLFHARPWVLHEGGERAHAACHDAMSNFLGMYPSYHMTILHGSSNCTLHVPLIESFGGWLQFDSLNCVCNPIINFNTCLMN